MVLVTVVDCSAPHRGRDVPAGNIPVDAAVTDVANEALRRRPHRHHRQTGRRPSDTTITYLIDSEQDRVEQSLPHRDLPAAGADGRR